MDPLEKGVNEKLIPAIFGIDNAVRVLDRDLFALQGRHSGMGFENPTKSASHHHRTSRILSAQHVELILTSQRELKVDRKKQKALKVQLNQEKEEAYEKEYERIYLQAPEPLAKAMELAKEKGASALVTTLPLTRHGFMFRCKRDFRDLIRIRYYRPIPGLPSTCV